ncbi:MYXO-CTERM sorting domain-containing protein [Nannocystis bainbridge]|uniref:MYXO-CTERM sorting domain-containing protein n=1 Tax=Nannocystis bainbridge TaxID=2995303 RepID=A0ABT5E6Z2_9BACT|nr:MYXO-CTERM sorting domain-containing protein [Nannocystis bainbridge]MDC0721624.1 MYXO-CTERM sorting domain-containing protein [Nannocystis bainbridge]
MSSRRISCLSTCMTILVAAAGLVVPRGAAAQQVVASDCNLDFTNVYNKGDAVCVTGDLDYVPPSKIFAEAYIYVIPLGSASPFADASGAPNYIIATLGAGGFIDEYVWLPPLKSGQYEFVIDNHPFWLDDGAPFDPGKDLRTGLAFTVSTAPLVYSVDPTMIKAEAVKGVEMALGIRILTSTLAAIDSISTVVDWSIGFGQGGGIAGGLLGIYCNATGTDCPTSYNSAVITIGNKILNGIADSLEKKFYAIIADPPDPDFAAPVALDVGEIVGLGFPATPGAEHPFARGQVELANLIALQSAAYTSLVPSMEKAQGAFAAGNGLGMLIQSEKVKAYAELAIAAGERLVAAADAFEAHLVGAGIADAGYAKDSFNAALQGFKDGGPSAGDTAFLRSFGLSDTEIAEAVAVMQGWAPVDDDLTYGALVERARGSYLAFKPALLDLVAQADAAIAENEAGVLRPGPKLTVAAPAPGKVGEPVQLTAQTAHFDPQAALTYAWDLDLDGEFDDAAAALADYVPTAPGVQLVRVRVSDGKLVDYAYVLVDVTVANAPPEVTALTPSEPAPFADVGDVVGLHVEAIDADDDPVTIAWTVDGAPAGAGLDLAFVMPDEEAHWIRVVIADDDPRSPDVAITRVIRAKKWESMSGETDSDSGSSDTDDPTTAGTEGTEGTGGDTSGGTDATTGEAPTTGGTGGGPGGTGATQGSASTGDTGEGSDSGTGGTNSEGGCGCRTGDPAQGLAFGSLVLLALGRRRRR